MRYIVASDGSGDYRGVQAAIDAADTSALIVLKPGVYREKVVLYKDGVTLQAEPGATLVWNDSARQTLPDGAEKTTFLTATLLITGADATVEGLTVVNDAGDGRAVGQAVALYAAGDRGCFRRCRLIAAQDTLFCGPTMARLARSTPYPVPQGIAEVAERPPVDARLYFEECYVQGDVDFIFGPYCCWFERCALHCNERGGYYTAANTPEGQPYGLVFNRCALTGACGPGEVYLGRPWREHAATAFLRCRMDACVHPRGFTEWMIDGQPFRPVTERLCEYASTGGGADSAARNPSMRVLNESEAAGFTREAVLSGADDWRPWARPAK